MAAKTYYSPFIPAFSSNGLPIAGAQLAFYLTGTTTPTPIYADSDLETELTNPVVANGAGRLPAIYLDDSITYRVRMLDAEGDLIDQIDDYIPGTALRGPAGPPGDPTENIGAIDIAVAYGNSLVHGNSTPPEPAPALIPYPTVLNTALTAASKLVVVRNEGQSGETAKQISYRAVQDLTNNPAPKVVLFGPDAVNSFRKMDDDPDNELEAVKAQLQAMYTAAKAAGAHVIVLTDPPWKGYVDPSLPGEWSWTTEKQEATDLLNAWKMTTAFDVDARYDIYPLMEGAADTLSATYDLGDHLHILQAGQTLMADTVLTATLAGLGAMSARLVVEGDQARIDQDVSTQGSPNFKGGGAFGVGRGGFDLFGSAFTVNVDEDNGIYSTHVNSRRPEPGSPLSVKRGLNLDGICGLNWLSIGRGTNKGVQGSIGIVNYGTDVGSIYFAGSDGETKISHYAASEGFLCVASLIGQRAFNVYHSDYVGVEIGPSDRHGDVAGRNIIISLYRPPAIDGVPQDAEGRPLDYNATEHIFKAYSGDELLELRDGEFKIPHLDTVDTDDSNNTPNLYLDPVTDELKRAVWWKPAKPTISDPPTQAEIQGVVDTLFAFGIYGPPEE